MEVGWLALGVSIFALALTAWNTQRAIRKDSVYWVQRDKVSRAGSRAGMWNTSIRNYGHGRASDVRVYLMHQFLDAPEELTLEPTVGLGELVGANITVNDMSNETLATLKIIVKWRQAPAFEKDRSRDFPFPIDKKHGGTGEATGLGAT